MAADHSASSISPLQVPTWDNFMCGLLQNKPLLCEYHINQGFNSRVHNHVGTEFLFCKSGDGVLHHNGRPIQYSGPVVVQMKCSTPHAVAVNGVYERWNLCIEPNALKSFLSIENELTLLFMLRDFANISMAAVSSKLISRLENLYIDISDELDGNQVHHEKILPLLLQQFMYLFSRLLYETGVDNSNRCPKQSQLLDIVAYIKANLDGDISARTIAQAFHYSENHVYRLVQQLTGYPLGSFLKKQRIQAAENMLMTTDMPIARVGEAVGIRHPVQFSRAFHEVTGLSPSNYRLRNRMNT